MSQPYASAGIDRLPSSFSPHLLFLPTHSFSATMIRASPSFSVLLVFAALHLLPSVLAASARIPSSSTSSPSSFPTFQYDKALATFHPTLPLQPQQSLPGPVNVSFPHPEGERWFLLYVSSKALSAAAANPTAIPLTFWFHGYTRYATDGLPRLLPGVEQLGWAIILGQGTLGPNPVNKTTFGWNAGFCCTFQQVGTPLYQPDDVSFTTTALQATRDLLKPYNLSIDADRVFTMGESNGGMMSERLGCERPDLFRAIASVIGDTVTGSNTSALTTCDNEYAAAISPQSRSFSVLSIHGTADSLVPWNGGGGFGFPSIPDDMTAWRKRMGCSDSSGAPTFGPVSAGALSFSGEAWSACAYKGSQVELVTVAGGVHEWFTYPSAFNASDYTLAFFQRVSAAGPAEDGGSDSSAVTVAIASVAVLVLLGVIGGAITYYCRRKALRNGDAAGSEAVSRNASGKSLRQKLVQDADDDYTAM